MGIGIAGADLGTLQQAAAVPRLLRGAITYAAGSTGAIGATTLFTVTGDVLLMNFAAKATTSLTSGGVPTFNLDVVGNTGGFFGSGPDVTGWTAGKWFDGYTTSYSTAIPTANLIQAANGMPCSANIIQTIATATITGGVVRWYLQYVPLSGDGAVSLHSNLVAF